MLSPWVGLGLGLLFLVMVMKFLGARRSPEELETLRALVRDGGLLVDVRTAHEFAQRHPAEAVNVPLNVLIERLPELATRDQAIVLCCATGSRSRAAVGMLSRVGFTKVYDLGPHTNW